MPIVKSTSIVEGEAIDIYIEVDDLPQEKSPYGNTRGDGKDIPKAALDMFESGLDLARQCAKQAVMGIHKMDEKFRPEEFEVKLAVKLDSEVGAVLAKVSTGAQMEVTMKWKPRGSMGAGQS
jgi:Trypsin-co-occurring domain 1